MDNVKVGSFLRQYRRALGQRKTSANAMSIFPLCSPDDSTVSTKV